MHKHFKHFYRLFYQKTNGFIPTMPLNQNVYPGDYFIIENGEMIVVGNVFQERMVDIEEVEMEYCVKLNSFNWDFSEGLTKPYSGKGTADNDVNHDINYIKQTLAFGQRGDFVFKGSNPESIKCLNWNELKNELIIKLTQTHHSFRKLYLVTEVATTQEWALAVAGSDNARLELAISSDKPGLEHIFGNPDAQTIQARDLEYYNIETNRRPMFFKAKKLVLNSNVKEDFISNLLNQRSLKNEWVKDFFDYNFHTDLINYMASSNLSDSAILGLLQPNQLNPNTALNYFEWDDFKSEDIALLFQSWNLNN